MNIAFIYEYIKYFGFVASFLTFFFPIWDNGG